MACEEICRAPNFKELRHKLSVEPIELPAPIVLKEDLSDFENSDPVCREALVCGTNNPVLQAEVTLEMQSDAQAAESGLANIGVAQSESTASQINEIKNHQINDQDTDNAMSQKILKFELELKRLQLQKEQLDMERILAKKEYRIQKDLLNTELEMALTRLMSLKDSQNTSNSAVSNNTFHDAAVVENNNSSLRPSCPPLEEQKDSGTVICQVNEPHNDNETICIPAKLPGASIPLGLQQLNRLDCVSIRQLRSRDLNEAYEVVEPRSGQVILRANVDISIVGNRRTLRVEFIDNAVKEIAVFKMGPDSYMDLVVSGQLAARVKKMPTYMKPMLMIYDSHSRPALKIKGPGMTGNKYVIKVQTISKHVIGRLDKRPAPASPQYERAHAVIQLPGDLHVHCKLAVVAANFLIVDRNTMMAREHRLEMMTSSARNPVHHYGYKTAGYPTSPDY